MRRFFVTVAIWVFILPFTFILAWRLVRPRRRALKERPEDYGVPFAAVEFTGPAGSISAWWLPGTSGRTLIALHGIGDNKQQWLAPAVQLQARGFSCLLMDFRAHGESGGRFATYGDREAEDVAAALDYLRGRGDVDMGRVGAMGLSLGGITAIIAAAQLPDVRAVVAEAAFADLLRNVGLAFSRFTGVPPFPFANLTAFWAMRLTGARLSRVRPVEVIGRIAPRPVLIIGDLDDSLVNEPEASNDLYARAGEPKELWQIPGTVHVGAYQADPAVYIARLDAFFRAAL